MNTVTAARSSMASMRSLPLRPDHRVRWIGAWAGALALLFLGAALAHATPETPAPPGVAKPVYTRAVVRSLPSAAEPNTVRLKLLPHGKLPFTTVSFGVERPELLQDIRVGDEVGFVAERRASGNTLMRLRKVAPCVRFQPCPNIAAD